LSVSDGNRAALRDQYEDQYEDQYDPCRRTTNDASKNRGLDGGEYRVIESRRGHHQCWTKLPGQDRFIRFPRVKRYRTARVLKRLAAQRPMGTVRRICRSSSFRQGPSN